MEANELIKPAPEIAKIAAPLAAAVPLTAIVKRMLGPAADEFAEMWRDQVRLYRYERQLKCVEKAERMAQEAGFTPRAVPIKLLFPLLEGASFEEDEDLHTMWAALLANAASPENAEKVRPGFIATLRQMSKDEAMLLNWIYDQSAGAKDVRDFNPSVSFPNLSAAYASLGFGTVSSAPSGSPTISTVNTFELGTCLNSLGAEQLVQSKSGLQNLVHVLPAHSLTFRGFQFVTACRPPKPQK